MALTLMSVLELAVFEGEVWSRGPPGFNPSANRANRTSGSGAAFCQITSRNAHPVLSLDV